MAFDWSVQRVIVTGGAGGIGRATVLRLLEAGARVSVWDFNKAALESFAGECADSGYSLHTILCDISNVDEVKTSVRASLEVMGGITALVNNAGYMAAGNFQEREFSYWSKTIQVNVNSLLFLCYELLPHLKKANQAYIINLSSAAGVIGTAGLAVYSAAKWAVWGFSEALRQELHSEGTKHVSITTVHPSYLASGMFEGARIKGVGGLLVPPVKSHDHVARAIVSAIKNKRNRVMIPSSVNLAILMRALFSDKIFQFFMRFLKIHNSMASWNGKGRSID